MQKQYKISAAIFALIVLIIAILVIFFSMRAKPADHPSNGSSKEPDTSVVLPGDVQEEQVYVLKAFQGNLAVFREGETEPKEVLDILVHTLPAYDQGLLENGVRLEGEEELHRAIEDYTS